MEHAEIIPTEPPVIKQEPIQQGVLKIAAENRGKVLVVEDEDELAEILEFNLIRRGFDVLVAVDGLEACRVIGREKPDLILLDLLLPLLDGWEICRMVRSHHDPQIAKTPIIMLSALGSTNDRIKGYDLGADLYLPKPYAIKEVIVKTQQLIIQHRENLKLAEKINFLQKSAELQDQWQQVLFHELRNQLALISGIAEYLQDSTVDLARESSCEFAGQIVDSSHYLGSLAENYLLVRNIENHSIQLQNEMIDLHKVLLEVTQLFKTQAAQKSCDLEVICPTNLELSLHPISLKIILSSLLDNALKHAVLDGHISISVEKTASRIQLQIQDDGLGIEAEEREKVFEKFYRGTSTGEKPSGTGLGLYMARTLAETMDGTLQLIDNQLPGSCFQLRLPFE
ncbi:MAG: hybrid sensor histidine kinase/response regulator [Thermodesulfobacteriota bacterium]|nr:hybrid sensor histidine kinase/response regulator [Thermodesulfobacteriota bacterium]